MTDDDRTGYPEAIDVSQVSNWLGVFIPGEVPAWRTAGDGEVR